MQGRSHADRLKFVLAICLGLENILFKHNPRQEQRLAFRFTFCSFVTFRASWHVGNSASTNDIRMPATKGTPFNQGLGKHTTMRVSDGNQ